MLSSKTISNTKSQLLMPNINQKTLVSLQQKVQKPPRKLFPGIGKRKSNRCPVRCRKNLSRHVSFPCRKTHFLMASNLRSKHAFADSFAITVGIFPGRSRRTIGKKEKTPGKIKQKNCQLAAVFKKIGGKKQAN